jgi:hypothetical protein
MSPSRAITRCAASAMFCKPVEQNRLTVRPEVATGQPARNATSRAMLRPPAPSRKELPKITSSTSPGAMPARSIAC